MNTTTIKDEVVLKPWQHAAIFLIACAIAISRRPDAIFHAQFFAEDGHVWFADAYNLGWWHALFRTWAGYIQTLPRLVSALALLAPLARAPLILNLIAIPMQALPACLLLSSRSSVWGSLRFRALLAAIYLALPNNADTAVGITNSQWLLAVSAFLVLVASPPRSTAGRVFDFSIVLLFGLTGPFCIFLMPISLLFAWRRGGRWRWLLAGTLVVLCALQVSAILSVDPSSRATSSASSGASVAWFIRILSGQIYVGALLGSNEFALLPGFGHLVFLICIALFGTAVIVACFVHSSMEMRLFLIYAAMILGAELISPQAQPRPGVTVWQTLAAMPGIRYWYFPTLAFAWSIPWCLRNPLPVIRVTSTALLSLMCVGIVRDWRHPAFQDLHFSAYVKRFEASPAGTTMTIPENPDGWDLRLVKR